MGLGEGCADVGLKREFCWRSSACGSNDSTMARPINFLRARAELGCWMLLVAGGLPLSCEAASLADNFGTATPLTGILSVVGSNILATAEPFEPAHAGEPAHHSVWATWTATVTGSYSVSTTNSFTSGGARMDTVLAVYTGSALTNLVPVVDNDDMEPFNVWSRVVFRAYAGETFQIAVDGVGATGIGTIHLQFDRGGPFMEPWTATNITGQIISSSDFNHQLVIVDIWETTCGACIEELPDLVHLYNVLHPRGYSMVGLSGDPNIDLVRNYYDGVPPPYLIGMNNAIVTASLGGPFGLGPFGFPTKFMVDQEGRIVAHYLGAAPVLTTSFSFYSSVVEPLLRPPPTVSLLASRAGDAIRVSWPTGVSGFRVQSADDPTAVAWNDIRSNVQTNGDRYEVILPANASAQFFRLKKP